MDEISGEHTLQLMTKESADGYRMLSTNRFQLLARAKQYYLVEAISRHQDKALDFQKKNQNKIFGHISNQRESNEYDEERRLFQDRDNEREVFDYSNPTFLADSFTGSPRHLKSLAFNALRIVEEYDKPTVFITLTVNTRWPEIQERLFRGQTAFDREDIVCRVFKQRLKAFLFNLRAGKYFGGAKVVYELHVIEYQHRGAPHAHIVARLNNCPNHLDKDDCIAWIDRYISKTLPRIPCDDDSADDVTLYSFVDSFQRHKCYSTQGGCKQKDSNFCALKFNEVCLPFSTTFDEFGYPQYACETPFDYSIVPYNREILLDWGAHCNVEFASKTYTAVYLYKYLFKGNKKVSVQFDNTFDVDPKDEIRLFVRGRFICAFDAMWRILGYQTYPATKPSVLVVKVKMPYHLIHIRQEGQLCDLLIYLHRPLCLVELTYTAFFKLFDYSYAMPKRFDALLISVGRFPTVDTFDFDAGGSIYTLQLSHIRSSRGICKDIYVYKRTNPNDVIVRMSMNYITNGEIWYLRLILLNYPIHGDLLNAYKFQGVTYDTFQEVAVQRHLVTSLTEAEQCFKESMEISSPAELRSLLVMLTCEGFPTLGIYNNPELRFYLYEDLLLQNQSNTGE
jgi:hypothetical protein